MEKICPKHGGICPAQENIDDLFQTAPRAVQKVGKGLWQIVRHQAQVGICPEGPVELGSDGITIRYCGNSNQPKIEEVYGSLREDLELEEHLPEKITSRATNE